MSDTAILIDATAKRFWNGHMVGPETGHVRFEYKGDPEKMPKDFKPVSKAKIKAEDQMRESLAKAKDKASQEGISLEEALRPEGDVKLPTSGGTDQVTVDAVKAVNPGIKPDGAEKSTQNEKPTETPKQLAARLKREEKLAEKNEG